MTKINFNELFFEMVLPTSFFVWRWNVLGDYCMKPAILCIEIAFGRTDWRVLVLFSVWFCESKFWNVTFHVKQGSWELKVNSREGSIEVWNQFFSSILISVPMICSFMSTQNHSTGDNHVDMYVCLLEIYCGSRSYYESSSEASCQLQYRNEN